MTDPGIPDDPTGYLVASLENARRLDAAIARIEAGQVEVHDLSELSSDTNDNAEHETPGSRKYQRAADSLLTRALRVRKHGDAV